MLRTKGEQKAYLDGYEMCAECIEKYLTDEGKRKLECLLMAVRNAVEIEDYAEPQETVTEFADKCKECGTRYIRKSVVEDIKAEIQASMDMYKGCEYIGDKARRDELWHVLEIIDKHTGKERMNEADN